MKESMAVSSAFFDYTEKQLLKAEHSFALIAKEAEGRPVILILLPLKQDLIMQAGLKGPSPLTIDLQKFATEKGILLLDLLPLMSPLSESPEDYYFNCDGHWNSYGNRIAHDLVKEFLIEQNLL